MTDYFIDFAPADAVQYDGTNLLAICAAWDLYEGHWARMLSTGQWLVRQGSRVWVQDEEPARVERWLTGQCDFDGSVAWHRHNCECYGPLDRPREVRPVLSNGWTGPWTPVEGGAE